ncbi:MAG: hypothetical protein GY788_05190 [bacterium]|nr:hypothetical protein [bacterium]
MKDALSAAAIGPYLPLIDLGDETVTIVDAATGALSFKDADLDLNHVEPTCLLWRVLHHTSGFFGREGFVGRGWPMGRQSGNATNNDLLTYTHP